MPRLKLILLFLLIALPLFCTGQALPVQERQYATLLDLKSELLVYDGDYDTYLPYAQGTPFSSNTALSWLPLAQYKNYQLLIKPEQQASVFINQNINDNIAAGQARYYSLDSLYARYGDSCLVAVFAQGLNLNKLEYKIVGTQAIASATTSELSQNFLSVRWRPQSVFYNFFILAALGVLAALALLRNSFPRVFASYYSLSDTLSTRHPINDAFSYKLGGTGQLGFIIAYCLIFSFLLISLFHVVGQEATLGWMLDNGSAGAYVWSWLKLALLLFILQLVKYGLLQIASGLFGIDVAANHFFDYLRFSQLVITFLLAVVLVLYLGMPGWTASGGQILLNLILLLALLRITYLFYKLTAAGERRKTYLFSYLCVTEILPLLVGLKLLVY